MRLEGCTTATGSSIRTSLGDLGEGQTGASLQVDIVGVNESTQGPKRLSGEEVSFGALDQGR